MAAGLPGKGATSLDAPSCAVTVASGDVMKEVFCSSRAVAAASCLPRFFGSAGHA
jgi:hypothetical protein